MLEKGFGIAKVEVNAGTGVHDHAKWKPKWKIEKYNSKGELYAVEEFDGNLLLFDGISEFMKAACGVGGTAFSGANAKHIKFARLLKQKFKSVFTDTYP